MLLHPIVWAAAAAVLFAHLPLPSQDGWAVRQQTAARPGPTVLVVAVDAGVGAGAETALRQLARRRPERGVLATARPLRFGERRRPQDVGTLKQWTAARTPDVVVVLREDRAPHSGIPSARGTTIAGAGVETAALESLAAHLEARAPDAGGGCWLPLAQDVARPEWALAAATFVVTTTHENERKEQRLSLRARQHRLAVHRVLQRLGMLGPDPATPRILPPERADAVRVAVYDGPGAVSSSGHGPPWIVATLAREPGFVVEPVAPSDILDGALADCDVVLFGGGSARAQAIDGLGPGGRDAVRRFVASGGGYVGICAGGFLACTDSDHDLGLIDVTATSTYGSVTAEARFDGSLGLDGVFAVKFSGGPRFALGATAGMNRPMVWARFGARGMDGELASMVDRPAVVAAPFGSGRAVAFSPHCERAPGPRAAFLGALRWAAGDAAGTDGDGGSKPDRGRAPDDEHDPRRVRPGNQRPGRVAEVPRGR